MPLDFEDLTARDLSDWGLSADDAARRLRVKKDGQSFVGVDAFSILWAEMSRFRFLSRLVGFPIVRHLAGVVYDYALAPMLYAWHRRRVAHQIKA